MTGLTFLYHSLQNIHVVFLRHSTERGELGLGDKLQELEQRKEKDRKEKKHNINFTLSAAETLCSTASLLNVCYAAFLQKSTRTPHNKCHLEKIWSHSFLSLFETEAGSKDHITTFLAMIILEFLNLSRGRSCWKGVGQQPRLSTASAFINKLFII